MHIIRETPSRSSLRLIAWLVLILITPGAAVAEFAVSTYWTNSSGGNWKDPYWSSGLPQNEEAYITNNGGSKTIVFDASSYSAYTNAPNFGISLSGAEGITNTLIFDLPNAMVIGMPYGFDIDANGILENRGASILMSPTAYTTVSGTVLQSAGTCDSAGTGVYISDGGTFSQAGGTNALARISCFGFGTYQLSGGTLNCTDRLELGALNEGGTFSQSGGTLTVSSIIMPGLVTTVNQGRGVFSLSAGAVEAGSISVGDGSSYGQSGGVVNVVDLGLQGSSAAYADDENVIYASCELDGGILSSTSESLNLGYFTQNGGSNIVTGSLDLAGGVSYGGPSSLDGSVYYFDSGRLFATNISVGSYSSFHCERGTNSWQISNSGVFSLSGSLTLGNNSQQLGALAIAQGIYPFLPAIKLGSRTVLKFTDSSAQAWGTNASLTILNWNGGSSHLLFGTNKLALTTAQLAQIQFTNPVGLPAGSYNATILNTGEVVPNVPALFWRASESGLVLTWFGSLTLQTSTEPQGPYLTISNATNPYTNNLPGDRRFFRLAR